jgi:hypothetical protein
VRTERAAQTDSHSTTTSAAPASGNRSGVNNTHCSRLDGKWKCCDRALPVQSYNIPQQTNATTRLHISCAAQLTREILAVIYAPALRTTHISVASRYYTVDSLRFICASGLLAKSRLLIVQVRAMTVCVCVRVTHFTLVILCESVPPTHYIALMWQRCA